MPYAPAAAVLTPNAHGRITLSPDTAELKGKIQVEQKGGQSNLGYWGTAGDSVSWTVRFPAQGKYKVRTSCASVHGAVDLVVEIGKQMLSGVASKTGSWDDFAAVNVGSVNVAGAGQLEVRVQAKELARWQAINLRAVKLTPE